MGVLTLILSLLCCHFACEFSQDVLDNLCRPTRYLFLFFCSLEWTIFKLGGRNPWKSTGSLGCSLQNHMHGIFQNRTLNKVCSPIRVVFLPVSLSPSFQDPELHQPMVTAAQAAPVFPFLTSSSLFVSMRSRAACPLVSSVLGSCHRYTH